MKNHKLIFLIFFLIFSFLLAKEAKAGQEHNVSGFAWSENIGWISFNNTSGAGNINYGVNVNLNNGKLSGYAWSEHIGWLSFNEADTGVPPSNDPCPDASCIAMAIAPGQLGRSDVYIRGWARALAQSDGWDGWLRFDHTQSNPVYIDPNGDFQGWAWGSDVVGWLSFNCENQNSCGTLDYKVTLSLPANQPPSATNLSASQGDYCGALHPPIYLSWTFSDSDIDVGDSQSAYQVQVDNNQDFSSPEKDSGKVLLPSNTYAPPNLSYNTTYYWRVIVWDSSDVPSAWAVGTLFTTAKHAYPSVSFTWQPQYPKVNQTVAFTDQSSVYGGATKVSWSWTFQDASPASSNLQNPKTKFLSAGAKEVTLRVTDSDGYACLSGSPPGTPTIITIQQAFPSPQWKEIPPTSWIIKFLASTSEIFQIVLHSFDF